MERKLSLRLGHLLPSYSQGILWRLLKDPQSDCQGDFYNFFQRKKGFDLAVVYTFKSL